MTIHLRPEIEALIVEDVKRGPYRSADEFVEEAVRQLHAQENWMVDNRGDIEAAIEEGYAEAQRGELLTPESLRARLDEGKQAWRSGRG